MNQRIIYPTDDGVAIIVPAAECGLTIEEIAAKDVPTGKPYKIVDVASGIKLGEDSFLNSALTAATAE